MQRLVRRITKVNCICSFDKTILDRPFLRSGGADSARFTRSITRQFGYC